MARRRPRPTKATALTPLSSDTQRSRVMWERTADEYESQHHHELQGGKAMAWGFWRLPESKLHLLGPVRGRRILELGCGAGDWSVALARKGARPTGLDVSRARLAQARRSMRRAGVRFPLIEGSAESLPFPKARFDVVFCDWGAMTFVDPRVSVPEVARVLRPGGRFVFSNSHPIRSICDDRKRDRMTRSLLYDYFGLHRLEFPDEVDFQLELGEWIRLFRDHRLVVDDLIEPRPGPTMRSSYLPPNSVAWARRWPMEVIWRLHRDPGGVSTA